MTDPHDPNSIPMLTDVIVPGRPPLGRPGETHAQAQGETPPEPLPASQPTAQPGAYTPPAPSLGAAAPFDAREIEFIAERLRGRFANYLRQDARAVIEARCRDAIEEHTNWLVRQVSREVMSVLEQEVAGWVRDAVSEELARHTSRR